MEASVPETTALNMPAMRHAAPFTHAGASLSPPQQGTISFAVDSYSALLLEGSDINRVANRRSMSISLCALSFQIKRAQRDMLTDLLSYSFLKAKIDLFRVFAPDPFAKIWAPSGNTQSGKEKYREVEDVSRIERFSV